MSKKPPAFQLYAADFYMDTAAWSAEQVGIYTRLLFYQWVNGSIPNDLECIARIAGYMENRKWRSNLERMWRELCHKFVIVPGTNNLVNPRLEETRQKQAEYRKKQSELAHRSVEARKVKGIFPFNQSSQGSSEGSNQIQALQSSSSSLKNKDIKAADAPVDNSKDPREQEVIEICNAIAKEIPRKTFNPHQWNHHHRNKNPSARIHTLKRILDESLLILDNNIRNPWPYADEILNRENGNYNEREYIQQHSNMDFNDVVAKLKQMQEAEK